MSLTKEEYIKEIIDMISWGMGDYVRTDVDDKASKLLEDTDDFDAYYETRSKGNIIRIDHVFMVWLNGIVFAWNTIHKGKYELTNDDIVPNWEKIVDNSRCIGTNGGVTFFGERCRLY